MINLYTMEESLISLFGTRETNSIHFSVTVFILKHEIRYSIQILSPGVKSSDGVCKYVDIFAHQISSRNALRRTLFPRNGKLGVFRDYENDLGYQQYPKWTSNILNLNEHKL